jgi:gas vesicle protein
MKTLSEQEDQYMDTQTQQHRDYGFVMGLVTGAFVGAGLAILLAPRAAAELRDRVTDSATRLGKRAAEQYRDASSRIVDAAGEFARKGNGLRDDVADTVARTAHEVERMAMAARSDRG